MRPHCFAPLDGGTQAACPKRHPRKRTAVARPTKPWKLGNLARLARLGKLAMVAGAVAAAVPALVGLSDAAGAQTSVSPVLSCPGSMVLDSGSGQCRTPRTNTVLRPSSCPAGWTRVAGQYGGHECQRRTTSQRATGRTRRVYSHTTYDDVWIPTGTRSEQTGTSRTWVPPRTMTEPLVPPVRVRTGTERRCDFDPISGQHYNCRNVAVYRWQTSHTVTLPGYWVEEPEFTEVETGYWDRVPTIHHTTEPIYETVVEWQSTPASTGSCGAGWRAVGRQCERTVLGEPSAAPHQSCPSGSVPSYGDSLGGAGPSVLSCQSSQPGLGPDDGIEQDDTGGSHVSPDGTARPLHHLAAESDERLAELGIHRCVDGLLSYVPCNDLPGREWNSDSGVCDDIEGTVFRSDHGGSCVTGSDLLNKCTTPDDCAPATIRTYCPAIGELSGTEIQQHVHPGRGAETYRVCVFECSDFGALPSYVQLRINGSYDYACRPTGPPEPTTTMPGSTTTQPIDHTGPDDTGPDDTGPDVGDGDRDPGERRPDRGDPDDGSPDVDDPDAGDPDVELPGPDPIVDTQCDAVPAPALAAGLSDELTWASFVRPAGTPNSQLRMPGGGQYLQVAPGRGWIEAPGSLRVGSGECSWTATRLRATWADLRPWLPAERREMESNAGTRHLVDRWDARTSDQQQLILQWHKSSVSPSTVECSAAQAAASHMTSSCQWLFTHPGAFAWQADACFELDPSESGAPESRDSTLVGGAPTPSAAGCWVSIAAGVDWIRSVADYADSRVTLIADRSRS